MGEFFGFDGRISRLGFLWRSIVALTSIAGLAAGSLWGLGHVYAPDGLAGPSGLTSDVVTGAILLLLWCSFALASRRLMRVSNRNICTVPARHGMHLPHYSSMQNSMKNFATSTMFVASSMTIMPPDPMMEPTAWSDS